MSEIIVKNLTNSMDDLYNALIELPELAEKEFLKSIDTFAQYIGYTKEEFAEEASHGAVGFPTMENGIIYFDMPGILIKIDDGKDDEFYIRKEFYANNKHARDLHPVIKDTIIDGYMLCGENYTEIEIEDSPAWFTLISSESEDILNIFNEIKDVMYGPMKNMLNSAHMTEVEFAAMLRAPYRTVHDWCTGTTQCKVYLRLLIANYLHLI